MVDKAKSKKTDETPAQRFSRVAGKRVAGVLDGLDRIAATAKSRNMENTPEQARKIVELLRDGIARVETTFAAGKGTKAGKRVVEL